MKPQSSPTSEPMFAPGYRTASSTEEYSRLYSDPVIPSAKDGITARAAPVPKLFPGHRVKKRITIVDVAAPACQLAHGFLASIFAAFEPVIAWRWMW